MFVGSQFSVDVGVCIRFCILFGCVVGFVCWCDKLLCLMLFFCCLLFAVVVFLLFCLFVVVVFVVVFLF